MAFTTTEQAASRAFAQGIEDLGNKVYGGSVEATYFLLPLSVSNANKIPVDVKSLPAFEDLSADERIAVRIIYETIHDNPDLIDAYPNVLGEIAVLGCELLNLKRARLERSAVGTLAKKDKDRFERIRKTVRLLVATIRRDGNADLTLPVSRPAAIVTRRARLKGDWSSARSWLGGAPKLGQQKWPREDGRAIRFVAQIDCAELQSVGCGKDLPENGALAFFFSTRGGRCVVYVPADEVSGFTEPPPDLPPMVPSHSAHGYTGDHSGRPLFPFWPVEFAKVELSRDMTLDDAYKRQLDVVSRFECPEFRLNAESLFDGLNNPNWWHTAIGLSELLSRVDRRLQRRRGLLFRLITYLMAQPQPIKTFKAFSAFAKQIEAWVSNKNPWTLMSESDSQKLESALSKAAKVYGSLLESDIVELGRLKDRTAVLLASADEATYQQIPIRARARLDKHYRRPSYCWHQMFGVPTSVQGNATVDNAGRHLLLQLASDDIMMCWDLTDSGVCQFWIKPSDLKAGNWAAVTMTVEGT